MALSVGILDKAVHDRADFDCGEPALNDFLATKAAKHQAQRVSRTFVLTDSSRPGEILGYYTLSLCQIARERLSEREARKLPKYPVPAVLLARLAVSKTAQGRRFGHWLLMDALKRCALVGAQSGVYALVVDAKNDGAKRFYEHFGFREIKSAPMRLYLPLATVVKAF
jgi:GNAT superfamily N-acetyltransferase